MEQVGSPVSHWALSRLIVAWSSPWLGSVCPVTDFACLTQNRATQSPGKMELGLLPGLAAPAFVCRGRCGHISPACREKLSPSAYERNGRQGNCRWAFFRWWSQHFWGGIHCSSRALQREVLQACNVSYWHATTKLMQQTNQKQICPQSFQSNMWRISFHSTAFPSLPQSCRDSGAACWGLPIFKGSQKPLKYWQLISKFINLEEWATYIWGPHGLEASLKPAVWAVFPFQHCPWHSSVI